MPEFTATDIYFYSQTQHRCEFNSGVRLSQNSPNRQSTTFFTKESFCDLKFFFRFLIGIGLKPLIIQHFDFLREPHSAVPLYADECGSLGFVAFSTVSVVSENTFSTRRTAVNLTAVFSCQLSISANPFFMLNPCLSPPDRVITLCERYGFERAGIIARR